MKPQLIYSCLIFLLFTSNLAHSQLFDDFSDGDITANPIWFGDTDDFVVNEEGELQLLAPEAGVSSLYTNVSFPDTIQLNLTFRLEMAPSSSNYGIIYLGLDSNDATTANGYYLQIGESGSSDAIKLYRLDNGVETLLATGTEAAIASDPAQGNLCITIYPDGLWSLSIDYDLTDFCELEFEFIDNTYRFEDLNTFGLYCQYTETRKENFFYDDISIIKFQKDETGPLLVSLEVIDEKSILLNFNEKLDVSNAETITNYVVNNSVGSPNSAIADGSRVYITFDQAFESGIEYMVAIMNITDDNQNPIIPIAETFILAVPPMVGDIVLSEILFDPYSGGSDFVEVYNVSHKYIDIQGLIISNIDKEEEKVVAQNFNLLPGQYLCFTEDKEFLIETYPTIDAGQIIEVDLPSFNNESGNVSISHNSLPLTYIDQFDYLEDYHFTLIDDTEGISLERISFTAESQLPDNWHSASSTAGYATPGTVNSNLIISQGSAGEFDLQNKVFSPNGDGDTDFLVINYKLEKPGYVANIKIFDDEGFERKQLISNELLSTEGLITWDGTSSEGLISEIGMYIILAEIFHPDGEVKNFKKVCILADFLE